MLRNQFWKDKLTHLGLYVDQNNGHLFYADNFTPIKITYELMFIRHGETYGNCGQTENGKVNSKLSKDHDKRIFQGNVDTPINQLTDLGKAQAITVANKLEQKIQEEKWLPDIIYHSPLTRARDTALPFIDKFKLHNKFVCLQNIHEMSFGRWDNHRICDLAAEDNCHEFYKQQNALVKEAGINANGIFQEAENFCDVLMRAHNVLLALEEKHPQQKIILFSHSLFGAACAILLGQGKINAPHENLLFDGVIPNATPILLNDLERDKKLTPMS